MTLMASINAVLAGACPGSTIPCSPLLSSAAPCSFARSTSPSSSDKTVRPLSATSRANSVPRIAPEATGVRKRTAAGLSRLKKYAAPDLRSSCGLALGAVGACSSRLVSSLTRTTLSSDQRNVARLRSPVRSRSPTCSMSFVFAAVQTAEPFLASSILPSFSTRTQLGAGMSAAGAIGNETPHGTRHRHATLATRAVARLENQHLPVAAVCDRRSFAKRAIFRLESQQSISAGASPKCIIKGRRDAPPLRRRGEARRGFGSFSRRQPAWQAYCATTTKVRASPSPPSDGGEGEERRRCPADFGGH